MLTQKQLKALVARLPKENDSAMVEIRSGGHGPEGDAAISFDYHELPLAFKATGMIPRHTRLVLVINGGF